MEPKSITHLHLLSVVAAECAKRGRAVRILDLGCGAGDLLRYLRSELPIQRPSHEFDIRGLDVSDFAPQGIAKLAKNIDIVKTGQAWPYPDNFFDFIVSNQVMEHVADHSFVFLEICRTLRQDGVSIHLFPLKCYVYEGHAFMPLVHRIRRPQYVRLMAKVFYHPKVEALPRPEMELGERVVEFLNHYTNYITERRLRRIAADSGLKVSFSYTPGFYTAKLRSLAKRAPQFDCRPRPVLDYLASLPLRFVSSVTVLLSPAGPRPPFTC
jgi:SAM-dependent methyltransferase